MASDVQDEIQRRAEDIAYKSKIEAKLNDISESLKGFSETIKYISQLNTELKNAIQLLSNTEESANKSYISRLEILNNSLTKLELEMKNNFEKIKNWYKIDVREDLEKSFEKIYDRNLESSMLNQLEDRLSEVGIRLVDENNEKSLISIFKKFNKEILEKINKENKARATITWFIVTLTGIISLFLLLKQLLGS